MKHNPYKMIGQTYNPKENAIGFLRLVFALFVVLQHSFSLNNKIDPLSNVGLISFGSLGVNGFFILSGYLITASWLNSKTFIDYIWKRILRIFPAFWVCLILIAFFFSTLIAKGTEGVINSSFFHEQLSYVYKNFLLVITQPSIGQITNSFTEKSLNGSFWTLSWEFGLYILLAITGVVGLLTKRKFLLLIFFILFLTSYWFYDCRCVLFFKFYVSDRVAILPLMFLLGVLGYLFRDKIPNNSLLFTFCIILWVFDIKFNHHFPLHPFLLLYITLWLAINLPFKSIEKYGDYSYGIYIYHFPIIQTIIFLFDYVISSSLLFILTLFPTAIFAYFSWHYVEKPILSYKNYFVKNK